MGPPGGSALVFWLPVARGGAHPSAADAWVVRHELASAPGVPPALSRHGPRLRPCDVNRAAGCRRPAGGQRPDRKRPHPSSLFTRRCTSPSQSIQPSFSLSTSVCCRGCKSLAHARGPKRIRQGQRPTHRPWSGLPPSAPRPRPAVCSPGTGRLHRTAATRTRRPSTWRPPALSHPDEHTIPVCPGARRAGRSRAPTGSPGTRGRFPRSGRFTGASAPPPRARP